MFQWLFGKRKRPEPPPEGFTQRTPDGDLIVGTGKPYSAEELALIQQISLHVMRTGKPAIGSVDDEGNLQIKDVE